MIDRILRILAINPGSTSTKIAVFDNEECRFEETICHSSDELHACGSIIGQKDMRSGHIARALKENGVEPGSIHAVVGRCGLVKPIESGTYAINSAMIADLMRPHSKEHAAVLGALIADDLGHCWNVPAFVVDPVVVDEMEPCAKLSGLAGIERRSVFHALNTKSVVRKAAASLGIAYEDGRFIAVHMGGGITVSAHRYGRVIDVNDAMGGDGPFTPDRSGSLPVGPIIDMCFSGEYTYEQMREFISQKGGVQSYLGTNDMREVETMIKQGDEFAALVTDAMAYQICKDIGAMFVVLDGRANAIVLTGGIAHSTRFTALIKKRVDTLAPVLTYAGENEMQALAEGGLRALRDPKQLLTYL